eukprot:g80894.t1
MNPWWAGLFVLIFRENLVNPSFYMSSDAITSDTLLAAIAEIAKGGALQRFGFLNASAWNAEFDVADRDMNTFWVIFTAVLVFWMQAGFGMIEAGSVRAKNVSNILFKNVMDTCIGGIAFWLVGYGFAFGGGEHHERDGTESEDEGGNAFIGAGNFALADVSNHHLYEDALFFFQTVFGATAATIISGAVAERCSLSAYLVYTLFMVAFIYPVVVHWVWSNQGWLSAFKDNRFPCGDESCNGVIDFAGSGVVHITGGTSALVAAWWIGPRVGKYTKDTRGHQVVNTIQGHSHVLICLGTLILWMGWYGFNCGSTLAMANGVSGLAGKVAVNTTLSASMGALTVCFLTRTRSYWDVPQTCNGTLSGLVGITAGCATVEPWGAFVIGIVSGFLFILGQFWIEYKLRIDDPVSASAIHGVCGAWGVLAVGIFSTTDGVAFAYGYRNNAVKSGVQFGTQLTAVLCIFLWTFVVSNLLWWCMSRVILVRVTTEHEKTGLDVVHHVERPRGDVPIQSELQADIDNQPVLED